MLRKFLKIAIFNASRPRLLNWIKIQSVADFLERLDYNPIFRKKSENIGMKSNLLLIFYEGWIKFQLSIVCEVV